MSVTVYTKPRCVQCNATYRALDKNGIAYESVDITEDTEAYESLVARGHQAAPVVVSPIGEWAGFLPDKITELAEYYANPVG
jgi:glutaredoxin-like protein NrdH